MITPEEIQLCIKPYTHNRLREYYPPQTPSLKGLLAIMACRGAYLDIVLYSILWWQWSDHPWLPIFTWIQILSIRICVTLMLKWAGFIEILF